MIKHKPSLEELNKINKGNMGEYLDIVYTDIGEDFLEGQMPVNNKTKQPYGLLHGGASVVLAETLGSLASQLCVDSKKQFCVGIEINANHIKGIRSGHVKGKASAIHIGKKTHVWEIKIKDEQEDLVCISRLTVAVIDKR